MRKLFVSAFALLSVSVWPAVHAESATAVINPATNVVQDRESEAILKAARDRATGLEKSTEASRNDQNSVSQADDAGMENGDNLADPSKVDPSKISVEPFQSPWAKKGEGVSELPAIAEKKEDSKTETTGVSTLPVINESQKVEEAQSAEGPKNLKLQKIENKELFNNPYIFVSVLAPGHWLEVPQKVGDGWEGSILVTADVLNHIMKKDGAGLARILIKEDALPALRNGAIQVINLAMNAINESDVSDILAHLEISEIMSYEDILRENGLFERYQSTIEDLGKRPHIGINVKYSNGLSIDIAKVNELYKPRIEMAKEIEKHISSLKDKIEERNKFISSSEQVKLNAIQKLMNEKAAAQKIVDDNRGDATELEIRKKALNNAEAELKNAEAMPTRTTRNKNDRTKAINTAKTKRDSAQKAYDELSAKIPTEYKEAKNTVDEKDAQIAKLDADPDLAAAKIMDKKYDKDIREILDKIKECYMRLAYLDPSQISAIALKAMKLPKDLKDKVAEWTSLKQRNDEIQKLIDANKDSATELEARKKALEDANSELKKAEAMPTRTKRNKNDRTNAIKAAQAKVAPAQKAYEEQLKKLPPEYNPAKEEYDDNSEKIKELATSDVMEAKKILDAFESEKNATPVA